MRLHEVLEALGRAGQKRECAVVHRHDLPDAEQPARDGRAIYFAGDTALFGDMRLIAEMYAPEIAFLPIGDHYTMDPAAAAKACLMLGVRQVVPMHYGTFPALTGRPDDLKRLVEPAGIDVLVLEPGETAQ